MHIHTHVMSGWCVANGFQLTPRERALAMFAAVAADLDGLGIFVSIDCYAEYHHVLAHNLVFGVVLAAVLACFSVTRRIRAFALYLAFFHLHLLLDYFGSGPGWGMRYFWPLSSTEYVSAYAWPLSSWQNLLACCLFLFWLVAIAIWKGRTPFEAIMPSLDAKLVRRFARG
jgi:hypothetical protein